MSSQLTWRAPTRKRALMLWLLAASCSASKPPATQLPGPPLQSPEPTTAVTTKTPSRATQACASWSERGVLDVAAAHCAKAHEDRDERASFDVLTAALLAAGDWQALFDLAADTLEQAPSWIKESETLALQTRAVEQMQLGSTEAKQRARELIAQANQALGASDFEAAARYLEQASSAADEPWVSAREGQLLARLGRSIEAERAFARARTQLRQLGTPPKMYLSERGTTFAWDGQRLAMLRDQQLSLLEGAPTAMSPRWSRGLPAGDIGGFRRFATSDWMLFFDKELAIHAGAVVRASDGQPYALRLMGASLGFPSDPEERVEQMTWANIRGTPSERELVYSQLTFPRAPLGEVEASSYPNTPEFEIAAAFEDGCRNTPQGVLCSTERGVVRRVPQVAAQPFESLTREEVVLPAAPSSAGRGLVGTWSAGKDAALSGDGSRLVQVVDRSLRITEVASGKKLRPLTLPQEVTQVVPSTDGRRVALLTPEDESAALLLVDVENRRVSKAPERLRRVDHLVFSPDGNTVLASGQEGYLLRVERNEVVPLPEFQRARFSADGALFGLEGGSSRGQLHLFDTNTGRALAAYGLPSAQVQTLVVQRNALIVGLCDGTVRKIDTARGVAHVFAPLSSTRNVCIQQLLLTPEGHWLLTAEPGEVRAWDLRGETALWRAPIDSWGWAAVASSRDGNTFAIGRSDGSVQVRAWRTGETLAEYAVATSAIRSVALAPSGAELVAADAAGHLHFVDLKSGTQQHFELREASVEQLGYRSDVELDLASASGTSRLHRESGAVLRLITYGDRGFCRSPDGGELIGGGMVGAELMTEGQFGGTSVSSTSPESVDVKAPKRKLDGPDWRGPCGVLGSGKVVAYVTEFGNLAFGATHMPKSSTATQGKRERLPWLGTMTFGRNSGWAFLSANGAVSGNQRSLLEVNVPGVNERLPGEVGWEAFESEDALQRALHAESASSPWQAATQSAK